MNGPAHHPFERETRDRAPLPSDRMKGTRRATIFTGLGLSLFIHALVLWMLLAHAPIELNMPQSQAERSMTVSLAPPATQAAASPPPAAAPALPAPAKPAPPKTLKRKSPAKPRAPKPPANKPAVKPERTPPIAKNAMRKAPAPAVEPPAAAAPDDMFTQLEAARKRRAEARAQAGLDAAESAPAPQTRNDNSIALANIATSLKRAKDAEQADSGGVFQLRRVGEREAVFYFRGWSANAGRNSTRLVTVDQGADIDIQTAVVKKMIEIIREERPGDFIWDSHRLGKQVELSARPQDSARLQQFLLKEFFPDYLPPPGGR